jgi:hypothetical protein
MYKLLQNQAVSNLHNEINELGWGAAAEKYPEVKAHLDATLGADKFSITFLPHYTHVADIDANTLEDAFYMHNNPMGDEILEEQITRYGRQHSMSVGDILVAEDGGLYICDTFGFEYVGKDTGYTTAAKSIIA